MLPAEARFRLGCVAEQEVDLVWTEIARINFNQAIAGFPVAADFFHAVAVPFDLLVYRLECMFDKLPHRMRFAGRQNVVVGGIFLQDAPHALDIVTGMAPVTAGIEITEPKPVLKATFNGGDGSCDLAGDEGFAAKRAFMIEQNAVGSMKAVSVAIIHRRPVGVELCRRIGAARREWRLFVLRMGRAVAEEFGCGSLVEAACLAEPQDSHGFKQPQRAERIGIRRIFRRFKTHLHMALRAQIINLVGPHFLYDTAQIGSIRQVPEMQAEANVLLMRVLIEMINARRVERRRPPFQTMDAITLLSRSSLR